jgi:hypothetical protein
VFTLKLSTLTCFSCSCWRRLALFTPATDDGAVEAAPPDTIATLAAGTATAVDSSPGLLLLVWWRTLSLFLFRLPDNNSHSNIMTPQQKVTSV